METNFVCPRCGNSDPKYIGFIHEKPYCRFCIAMNGEKAPDHVTNAGAVVLDLKYPLSVSQKYISQNLLQNYKSGIDTLINAVCGAGKTELVYHLMAYCLSIGQNVAFAVPRRDVVIELFARIKEVFPCNTVVAVYGQHTSKLDADIVVLTTHQLYRYEKYFDLIILDEIDAFPFKGNRLLETMFHRAVKGHVVMMSATPSKDVLDYFSCENRKILYLNTRFHKHPLPVPTIEIKILLFKYIFVIKKLKNFIKENKKVFVFVPTIEKCENLHRVVSIFVKNGTFVHSKCKNRSEIITNFKQGKYNYLVTTAVLERGVTFKNLQVIVFDADNSIYDSQSLVQIAGRVGRKIDAPEGEVVFVCEKTTNEIKTAIKTIKKKNRSLQGVFQEN